METHMKPYGKQSYKISSKPRTDLYSKGSVRQEAKREITQLTTENGYQKELDDDYDWDIEVIESLYCYHYKEKCDCFEERED